MSQWKIYHLANLKRMTQVNNNIDSLSPNFRKKFDLRRAEVISKYPNAVVFEARRSQERQNWLYSQGRSRPGKVVTWTRNSNHKDWNAVDIVFRNNWVLQRAWPYNDLIEMAKKYWIRNLAPKELCHFEDNGVVTTTQPPQTAKVEQFEMTASQFQDVRWLVEDKLFSWEMQNLTPERILIVLGRVYNKLKTQIK